MRFNNLLNRLRIRKIYAALIIIILILLLAIVLLLRSFFHTPSPDEVFNDYLSALQDGRYNDAVRHILPSEQDGILESMKMKQGL